MHSFSPVVRLAKPSLSHTHSGHPCSDGTWSFSALRGFSCFCGARSPLCMCCSHHICLAGACWKLVAKGMVVLAWKWDGQDIWLARMLQARADISHLAKRALICDSLTLLAIFVSELCGAHSVELDFCERRMLWMFCTLYGFPLCSLSVRNLCNNLRFPFLLLCSVRLILSNAIIMFVW